MGIVRNLANRISPAVKQLGDSLSEDYRYYQDNIDRQLLKDLKYDFHNMPYKRTPWVPASLAEYIVDRYIKKNGRLNIFMFLATNEFTITSFC